MTEPDKKCSTCGFALGAETVFCDGCGAAAPTHLTDPALQRTIAEAAFFRSRLNRAVAGKFDLLELLGSGGFGQVYRARDLKLGREVAIKVLRHDLAGNPQLMERFRREAQIVAGLHHPNILPIHHIDELDGIIFFVMPLVNGEALAEAMHRRTLSSGEAVRILRDISNAVQFAHNNGLVHRDLKPDNIMLEGPERRVLVMDFGIAKSTDGDDSGLTGSGVIIGTPGYMSPEQAVGDVASSRSDIYSLGVIGYELLTGERPFQGTKAAEVVERQLSEQPRRVTSVNPTVPPELADALSKCLTRSPEDRLPTAGVLAESLNVSGISGLKLNERRERHAVFHASIAATLIVLVIALGVVFSKAGVTGAVSMNGTTPPWQLSNWSRARLPLRTVDIHDSSVVALERKGTRVWNGSAWTSPSAFFDSYPVATDRGLILVADGRIMTTSGQTVAPAIPEELLPSGEEQSRLTDLLVHGEDMWVAAGSGRILRWSVDAGWEQTLASTSRTITDIFIINNRLHALRDHGGSIATDSLLAFNGISWDTEDIRPRSNRRAIYRSGFLLRDGTAGVVGALCSSRRECSPTILLMNDEGGWEELDLSGLPDAAVIERAWGRVPRSLYRLRFFNGLGCRAAFREVSAELGLPVRDTERVGYTSRGPVGRRGFRIWSYGWSGLRSIHQRSHLEPDKYRLDRGNPCSGVGYRSPVGYRLRCRLGPGPTVLFNRVRPR